MDGKQRYIFLTLDSKESRFVYGGFDEIDNGRLVLIDRGRLINRLTRKIIRLYTERGYCATIIKQLTQRIVEDQVIARTCDLSDEKLVFVVYARVYETLGRALTDALRKAFPTAKLCVYFADLQKRFTIDLDCYRRDFDCLFSFDKKQAEQFDMEYLLEPFTYKPFKEMDDAPIYDVTFVGRVKNDMRRYNDIMKVYEQCRDAGLKCDFHLVDVPRRLQKYPNEIEYNKFMGFEDIIRHVIQSHSVLEILQTDEYSPTTRYTEACLYGRNLITNCDGIRDGFYKKEDSIFLLDEDMHIDTRWIRDSHPVDFDRYRDLFSIESFVKTIGEAVQRNHRA